jgi:uncharacterized membrane protein YjgN (DUF898 family)
MSELKYNVVLKGVMPDVDAERAHADFAALFSLDGEQVKRLFSAPGTILKQGVDESVAIQYQQRLARIGVDVSIDPVSVDEAVADVAQPDANDTIPEASVSSQDQSDPVDAGSPKAETEQVSEPPSINRHEFQFTGSGFEYFKIWIVNLLLNIVTLGIYSAWAKVRNKQYFYGNTQIAGSRFEYTANPLKILQGRLIAIGIYSALGYAAQTAPVTYMILSFGLLAFIPWIIVSSLRFNARHTSYRNIAFRFNGSVGGAFVNFLLWPIVGILSLGLLMPFVWKSQKKYITNNHTYGTEPFHFDVSAKAYYKMLAIMLGTTLVFLTIFGLIAYGPVKEILVYGNDVDPSIIFKFIPLTFFYLLFNFVLSAYMTTAMANIHFNNMSLQQHKFAADWEPVSYLGLIVTNTLGILITLGLFIPFAKVRTAAYKAEHTSLLVAGDLDNFVARELEQSNSIGEGVHDIFDIDISL